MYKKMVGYNGMFKHFLFLFLVMGSLISCSPYRDIHGNTVTEDRMENIKIGQMTKDEVIREIGSPTTRAAFNDNIWYYIGLETVKHGFLDPKIENKKVFVATFDAEGKLSSFEEKETEELDIPIASRETPTHGTELTVLEQFIGNIGRFNSQEADILGGGR